MQNFCRCTHALASRATRRSKQLRRWGHMIMQRSQCADTRLHGGGPVLTESTRDVRFGSRSALLPAACVEFTVIFHNRSRFFLISLFFWSGSLYSAADVRSSQAPADGYVPQPLEVRRRPWLHELINALYEITFAAKNKGEKNGNSPLQRRLPNTSFWSVSL